MDFLTNCLHYYHACEYMYCTLYNINVVADQSRTLYLSRGYNQKVFLTFSIPWYDLLLQFLVPGAKKAKSDGGGEKIPAAKGGPKPAAVAAASPADRLASMAAAAQHMLREADQMLTPVAIAGNLIMEDLGSAIDMISELKK